MMKNDQNKLAGFSIVELLLYMALFMGFMVILGGLFASTYEVQTDATSTSHTDQDAWYLTNRFRYDLYRANSVVLPANNGDFSDTLILDIGGSQVIYSLVGDEITITESSQSASLNSGEVTVSNLSFQRLGNEDGISSITIQADLENSIISQTKHIDITVGLR